MPRIPRRLPFSRQFTAPEGQMYKIPKGYALANSIDDRRGYTIGGYAGLREPIMYRGQPVEPIQGPRLPDRVEEARQRYLDALADYRAEMEKMKEEAIYNRSLPERAARLKRQKWDKFLADENHPAYFEEDMDDYFENQVFNELDEREKFYPR